MRKTVMAAISGALAAGAILGAAPAQADMFGYEDNDSTFVEPVLDEDGKPVLGPPDTDGDGDGDGAPLLQDTNSSPWDFTGDVIKIFGFETQFIGAETAFGQNYQGVKEPKGHEGGRTEAKNPSE